MLDAVGTLVEQAHICAQCFQISLVQRIAVVMQDRLVEGHMPFQRVRAQAMGGQYIVDLAVRPRHTGIDRVEAAIGRLA